MKTQNILASLFWMTSTAIGLMGVSGGLDPVSASEKKMGLAETITPCPSRPNCVSSIDRNQKHFVEPLRFDGSLDDARYRMLAVLNSLKRTRVVTFNENYIHAESVSAILGFVDDVEFFFDARQKVIHVKSASRTGYFDLGVNRRRVETIRKRFDQEKKGL